LVLGRGRLLAASDTQGDLRHYQLQDVLVGQFAAPLHEGLDPDAVTGRPAGLLLLLQI
jgi:hypothetical protein